ncbi:MAG TPA: hypothetical protein VMV79_03135 [Alphaproteobacteria bacterium]|nr:hypothetical protein [Alphaproteobacteria bacterium]
MTAQPVLRIPGVSPEEATVLGAALAAEGFNQADLRLLGMPVEPQARDDEELGDADILPFIVASAIDSLRRQQRFFISGKSAEDKKEAADIETSAMMLL